MKKQTPDRGPRPGTKIYLLPNRHSIRRPNYDYFQPGSYFVTICVKDRACLFGEILDKKMILNDPGKMIEREWRAIPDRFPHTQLHAYVVMPNHFHAILQIRGGNPCGRPDPPLGQIIGAFQSIATVEYIRGVQSMNWPRFNGKLWQRNFWDHIIRDSSAFDRISQYIRDNPAHWKNDRFSP